MHTAEPELGNGGYFGMGVHRAARICAVGHGGQVLLSRSTAGLVDEDETRGSSSAISGSMCSRTWTDPSGSTSSSSGLREEFPPLRSVSELARSSDRLPDRHRDVLRHGHRRLGGSAPIARHAALQHRPRAVRARRADRRERAGGLAFEMVGDSFIGVSRARATPSLQPLPPWQSSVRANGQTKAAPASASACIREKPSDGAPGTSASASCALSVSAMRHSAARCSSRRRRRASSTASTSSESRSGRSPNACSRTSSARLCSTRRPAVPDSLPA